MVYKQLTSVVGGWGGGEKQILVFAHKSGLKIPSEKSGQNDLTVKETTSYCNVN